MLRGYRAIGYLQDGKRIAGAMNHAAKKSSYALSAETNVIARPDSRLHLGSV
jgi:hypothetical protein